MNTPPPTHAGSSLVVTRHRRGLHRARRAIESGAITLGFLGGSITDARPGKGWSEPVIAWFAETFPGLRVTVENAAIGATGSDSAVFRLQRDILDRDCDLLFIEYAANDSETPTVARQRTREGLLRASLAGEGRDVVFTYTFLPTMYADMNAGRVPSTVAEFEQLAEHYGIGSVWMGLHALREVQAGRMRWDEWLPDGIHPEYRGSHESAQPVIAFLERELRDAPSPGMIAVGDERPAALDPLNWEGAYALPFDEVTFDGPWTVRRVDTYGMGQAIETGAPGARLTWEFEGRALALGWDHGTGTADFRYRIDDRDWVDVELDRPEWAGVSGWYRFRTLAEDLPRGRHTVEFVTVKPQGPEMTSTNFRIGCIGIVP